MRTFRLYIYSIIKCLLPETRAFSFKAWMLRWCGAKVGRNVRINSSARFIGNGQLEICDDVWIGASNFIMTTSPARIIIGKCSDFGPQVTIITGTHEISKSQERIAGEGLSLSVEIGEGCWLGARCLILPGVELGPRTLVGAGAVVVKSNKEGNVLLAGNPAVVKKELSP